MGEPWAVASLPQREKKRVAVSIRRREAESKARAILQRRREERLDKISEEWREVNRDATMAVDLLGLFQRRPDLEAEFAEVAAEAEYQYGQSVSRRVLLEAMVDGEAA